MSLAVRSFVQEIAQLALTSPDAGCAKDQPNQHTVSG